MAVHQARNLVAREPAGQHEETRAGQTEMLQGTLTGFCNHSEALFPKTTKAYAPPPRNLDLLGP